MRMPRFAKLQNALIRRRSDKKKSGALAFFNSPLGLWILSAIFLTVGGSYITKRQECLAAARTNIELYKSLNQEIESRRFRILKDAASSSNSIDFYKALRSDRFAELKQFDGQSLSALARQLYQLRTKIVEVEEQNVIETNAFRDFPDSHSPYLQAFGHVPALSFEPAIILAPEAADQLYEFALKYNTELAVAYGLISLQRQTYDLVPACSAGIFLHDLWSDSESPSLKFVSNRPGPITPLHPTTPEPRPSTSTAPQK